MKKTVFLLLAFIACCLNVSAQTHWYLSHGNDEGAADNTFVLAKLDLGKSSADWTQYEIAAFIGDEVRAVVMGSDDVSPASATATDYNYFVLNVQGNYNNQYNADNGKTITFKMFNHATGIEYNLSSSVKCIFGGENTYGSPNSLVVLSAVEVTSIALKDIEMTVGATVELTDYLTLRPGNATVPSNIEWNVGNFVQQLSLNGSRLTANEVGTFSINVMAGEFTGTTAPLTATASVTVNEAKVKATAIRIKDGYNPITVNRGNTSYLTFMLAGAYELVPFDADEVVTWEVTGTAGIVEPTPIPNEWSPVKMGETKMQALIMNDDGTVRLRSEEVTIKVVVDVEDITAKLTPSPLVQGLSGTLTLTPNEGAFINLPSLLVTESSGDASLTWKLLSIGTPAARSDGSVTVPITALYPGKGTLNITYDFNNGGSVAPIDFEVGVPLTMKRGWQWVKLWGYIDESQYATAFSNNVDEIRSQSSLLAYDSSYGYYGDLTPGPNDGLKLKANVDVTADRAYVMTNGWNNLYGDEVELNKAWTWIPYPYVHSFSLNTLNLKATSGDRIVSKDNGFAEYSGGKWTGTLSELTPYETYLYYNNSGQVTMLEWPDEPSLMPSGTRAATSSNSQETGSLLHQAGWQYDSSRFRDNMSIVARLNCMMQNYFTVGAYVGDQCRGEGVFVNGLLFITVHANKGERVSFRLKAKLTGNMYDITETLPVSIAQGSIEQPVILTAPAWATGIEDIQLSTSDIQRSYDLNGRLIENGKLSKGLVIKRSADGTVRKVMMK